MVTGRELGTLRNSILKIRKSHQGTTIIAIISLFALLTISLQYFALSQFYKLALDREASALLPQVEKLLEEIENENLEKDLLFIDLGMEQLVYDENETLEILALRSLGISNVQSVYAYNKSAKLLDLPTNIDNTSHFQFGLEKLNSSIATIHLGDTCLSIIFPIGEKAEIGFLELQIDPTKAILPERKAIKLEVIKQGLIVFLIGTLLLLVVFRIFLFRLRKAEVELIKKSETLRKTNQRLSNACKSAGLGAISAHLMHAIKSPLMGLKNLDFGGNQKDKETATKMLKATTQKIESLIHDTLNSLREHELDEESYTFEIHELLSITSNKFSHLSKNNRVNILSSPHDSCKLDNLKANLLLPILENLVQNGLDASPDSKVFLQVEKKDDSFLFNVMDNGPGVPEVLKDKLFSPMQSNKKNGSGIGLAICKELAEQINAKITLKSSTDKGSTFCIQFIVKG